MKTGILWDDPQSGRRLQVRLVLVDRRVASAQITIGPTPYDPRRPGVEPLADPFVVLDPEELEQIAAGLQETARDWRAQGSA